MRLHQSNRLETLAGALADLMRGGPLDPFEPERIVVAHPTIERWLVLELARALGIAANVRFEQPAEFVWSVMRGVVPGLSRERPYAPARLRWRIFDHLPALAQEPWGRPVHRYLAAGGPPEAAAGGARRRFELADRLARVFDRYLLYRPDWIREWEGGAAARTPEGGGAPRWQAELWRRLAGAGADSATVPDAGRHWVAVIDAFRAALDAGAPRPPGWPRRASFFAVPPLSPSYLELLAAIAGHGIELHLFLLNPCREYWGDIDSQREIDRKAEDADPDQRYLTEGNELLAAWGRAGRDVFDSLVEVADAASASVERFVEPSAGGGRLAAVQRDILDLRLAADAARASEARGTDDGREDEAGGGTLQIHVCHSALREAEVLHDRLLGLFDAHPDLEPADVLVLTPEIGTYGPAIEAVFAAAGRIPFGVAHAHGAHSRTLQAYLDLLALSRSRLGAEAVLAPLEAPAVGARFGVEEADLPAIRAWLREAGIRWGADEAHRREEGLPETAEHTWRQGLRRLVLGYAMAEADELFAGTVPCPVPAGAEAELLGRFLTYAEAVCGLRRRLAGERRPGDWTKALYRELGRFFAGGGGAPVPAVRGVAGAARAREFAGEVDAVRDLVREFGREASYGESPVPFAVVLDVLRESAGADARGRARLADGVTVASLAPGCVFPAEVVCVVGMNDGAFPRTAPAPSFDRVASGPSRRGDRDPRREDRFAFLEALLAARRCFLVTYTGRSLRDDAPVPPSVVVDELEDYLLRRFPDRDAPPVKTRHPLQPFSPRYFSASGQASEDAPPPEGGADAPARRGLFSYSEGMRRAAAVMTGGGEDGETPARLAGGAAQAPAAPAGPGDDPARRVDLARLIAFSANPVRFFLRERAGARLEVDDVALDEDEPFELDSLHRYHLRTGLWERMRSGRQDAARTEAILRGSGQLPQAEVGRVFHERALEEVEGLRARLDPYQAVLDTAPRALDFELDGLRVVGAVEHVGPEEMVWWRIGKLRPQDRIAVRLRQLAWAAAGNEPLRAVAVSRSGRGDGWTSTPFPPPERACEELAAWLRAWRRGLAAPLPLFPATSLEYAKAIAGFADDGLGVLATARDKARAVWMGDRYQWGDRLDPYVGLVYDVDDPVGEEFAQLATELLVPLFEAGR